MKAIHGISSRPIMQRTCRAKLEEERPLVLVGVVMCRDFSQWMRLNWNKVGPQEKWWRSTQAIAHLRFVCSLYKWPAA